MQVIFLSEISNIDTVFKEDIVYCGRQDMIEIFSLMSYKMMTLKRRSFNYLFDNYLLSIYNVTGTVLDPANRTISKNNHGFCPFEA